MGRTLPSITQVFLNDEASLTRFRRALRRSDQLAFDDLLDSAQKHLSAAAYAAHTLPFEIFLLSMLLEEHKEVLQQRQLLEQLLALLHAQAPSSTVGFSSPNTAQPDDE
jgi:hypothetical protein